MDEGREFNVDTDEAHDEALKAMVEATRTYLRICCESYKRMEPESYQAYVSHWNADLAQIEAHVFMLPKEPRVALGFVIKGEFHAFWRASLSNIEMSKLN